MGCGASVAQKFNQTIVVLRHSERQDHVDSGYKTSPEGKEWPFDSPLTDRGVQLAKDTAKELAEVHKRANFYCVVSSPYRRCMQTAAEVAKCLNLPIMIDQEVGEVWEQAMPSDSRPHRTPVQLQEMAKELDVIVKNPTMHEGGFKIFGEPPAKWPETVEGGGRRIVVRVQRYIELSAETKLNFIIVSHAPAVSALAHIFNRGALDITKLDYCSYVVADRKTGVPPSPASASDDDKTKVASQTFLDTWEVDMKGVTSDLNIDASEGMHIRMCKDVETLEKERRNIRSNTEVIQEDLLRKEGGGQSKEAKSYD